MLLPDTVSVFSLQWPLTIDKEWVSFVTQLRLTLCDSMNYSLPGSSVHGILQARTLKWVPISWEGNGNKEPEANSFLFSIDEKTIYSEF